VPLADLDECQIRAHHGIRDRSRHEDLIGISERLDACRDVHRDAGNVIALELDLA